MTDSTYVDGFVCAVANQNKQAYIEYAKKFGTIFREYGALEVVDCWGDDVPEGKLTSFTMAVKREPDESIAYGWITWPSRGVRDEAWGKMQTDARFQPEQHQMPFDGKRMIFGGFQIVNRA